MMQQFYQRYLDVKSSLFGVRDGYQASYFHGALQPSSVNPRIMDPVCKISVGLSDLSGPMSPAPPTPIASTPISGIQAIRRRACRHGGCGR